MLVAAAKVAEARPVRMPAADPRCDKCLSTLTRPLRTGSICMHSFQLAAGLVELFTEIQRHRPWAWRGRVVYYGISGLAQHRRGQALCSGMLLRLVPSICPGHTVPCHKLAHAYVFSPWCRQPDMIAPKKYRLVVGPGLRNLRCRCIVLPSGAHHISHACCATASSAYP